MENPIILFTDIPLTTVTNLTFYVLLGIFAIFTIVMYYHWVSFATDKAVSRITLLAYMIMTLPLLLTMASLLFII